METMSASRRKYRRRSVDAPQTFPPTLPKTLAAQEIMEGLLEMVFDLQYGRTQPPVLGLPVDFYHLVHGNGFCSF